MRNLSPCSAALALLLLTSASHAQLETEGMTNSQEACSAENPGVCLDGVGSGVTTLDSLRVSTTSRDALAAESEERAQQQARANLAGGNRGVAAGEGLAGWTVWGSGGLSRYDSSVTIAPYDADAYTFLFGADRMFGERFLAGFTIGYENTDTNTPFNGGGQDREGLNVGLYGAVLINDVFSIDAAAGYGALDSDETRIDPGTGRNGAATPGATIAGSYDSQRGFVTMNVNAVKVYGAWVVGARLGALHAVESLDAYAETGGTGRRNVNKRHVDLTQAYASVDVGYSMGSFEPYALAAYRNDFGRDDGSSAGGLPGNVRPQPDDDDDWQGGLGVRYFGAGGISGSFEWLRTFGRDKFDEDNVSLTVRVPF